MEKSITVCRWRCWWRRKAISNWQLAVGEAHDPSVLLRIVRELNASTALDSSVLGEGKIRVGDAVEIV